MKFFSVVIFSLFLNTAFGDEGFRCIPSLRETRIQVLVKDEFIEARVVNAGGYKFMPQFSMPGSQFHLAFFKMQAEDLKELGEAFTFTWPKSLCVMDDKNFVVNCSGEATSTVNGIKAYGISTTEVSEKYQGETYQKRRFRINVEKDNIYFVSLEYYTQNCESFSRVFPKKKRP